MDNKKIIITASLPALLLAFGILRSYIGNAIKNELIDSIYNGVAYFTFGILLTLLLIIIASRAKPGAIRECFKELGKNILLIIAGVVLSVLIIAFRYGIVFQTHFSFDPEIPLALFVLTAASRTLEMLLLGVFFIGIILPLLMEYWGRWTAIALTSINYLLMQSGQLLASRGFDISRLLIVDVGLALSTAVLMYFILSYSYARTKRIWFTLGFLTFWGLADYTVFTLLKPDLKYYSSILDSFVVIFMLALVFFISKQIFNIQMTEKKAEDNRFRPKRDWVK